MKAFYLFIVFLLVAANINICFAQKNKTSEIIILHVNDIHSTINNFPKLSAYFKELKKQNQNVFLVADGDLFSGNPVVDQYPEKGFPIIDLMNKTGFIASAIGNHEFDFTQDVLAKRIVNSKFVFLAANLSSSQDYLKLVKPFIIIETNNQLKIALIGLTQVQKNGLPDTHPDKVKNIEFQQPDEVLYKYEYLKKENNAVVVLSHSGCDIDSILAEKHQFIDVIIGGHSHKLIQNPTDYYNTLITQAGQKLNYIGKLTLTFENGKLVNKKDELIKVSNLIAIDESIKATVNEYNNNQSLKKVIGNAEVDICGTSELGCLITDAIISFTKADIAFQNTGGIRIDTIKKGDITIGDIYRLDPFGNTIYTYLLSTDQIKELIKYSYIKEKQLDLETSGINYTIITNHNDEIKNIILTDYKTKKLDPNKKYKVAMNSYIANAYKFNQNKSLFQSEETGAEILIKYLNNNKNINYKNIKRIFNKIE